MEISFKTERLKKLCEQTKLAEQELGLEMAKKLRARMADLKAVSAVTELCAGRPHPLKGNRQGEFALDLKHPQRLVFEPANDPIPRKNDKSQENDDTEDTSIDWSRVTQVRIIWIGDYHD